MELREFAETVLFGAKLDDKLIALSPDQLTDEQPSGFKGISGRPNRPPGLHWASAGTRSKFPSLKTLEREETRGRILHFFANHELLALEIMALALLKFPTAPKSFRVDIARTMLEEQRHLRLYLARMAEFKVGFGDIAVSDFFWRCLRNMRSPLDYVAGMSLTFEQANLDFAAVYADKMQEIGDHRTGAILSEVLRDEIGHVKFGLGWFDTWRPQRDELFQEYAALLEPPLSPSRAKGQIMVRDVRLQAGLSASFVDQLEVFGGSKGRPPDIYWYNPDCEWELAQKGRGYQPGAMKQRLIDDQATLMMFVAKPGDLVLTAQPPSLPYLQQWRRAGLELPEFVASTSPEDLAQLRQRPSLGGLQPWGWTPRATALAKRLGIGAKAHKQTSFLTPTDTDSSPLFSFFRKDRLPARRQQIREIWPAADFRFGPSVCDGELANSTEMAVSTVERLLTELDRPVVVKAVWGAAGQGMRRILTLQDLQGPALGWINRHVKQHGAVLVEPWFDKQADFSMVWGVEGLREPTLTCFQTDRHGRYLGHHVGNWRHDLSPALRRGLFEVRGGESLVTLMEQIAQWVRAQLAAIGYHGPAGVDFPVFYWDDESCLKMKCLGEINPRLTMGHIAWSIQKRLSIGERHGFWRLLTISEIRAKGYANPGQAADALSEQVEHLGDGAKIFWTCDPQTAFGSLSALALGDQAVKLLNHAF
jgi:uncharacterized ferritin-like protein (DUF455 family)